MIDTRLIMYQSQTKIYKHVGDVNLFRECFFLYEINTCFKF